MSGLRLADAIGHGLNTYAQLQGIQANKDDMADRKTRSLREAQMFEMDKQAHEENKKFNSMRMKAMKDEDQEQASRLLASKLYAMEVGGDFSDQERQEYLRLTGGSRLADPDYLSRPEVGAALEIYPKVMTGEINRNDPRAIEAVNTLVNVQRGATDGRQVRINRIEPSADGQGVHFGLHVKNADGTENPNGVLTDNRSADPSDKVSSISFDELNEIYGSATKMRAIVTNPKYRQAMYREYGFGLPEQISAKDRSMINKNEAQAGYYNAKGKAEAEKGRGGGKGAATPTQRQKDYEFAMSRLGMDEDQALEWASSDKTLTERAEDYAGKMVAANKPVSGYSDKEYNPAEEWKAYRKEFIDAYSSEVKKKEPQKTESNQNSFNGQGMKKPVTKAPPQAAIDALKKFPEKKAEFIAKYGYLPE
jgi:hypothetical protein